MTDVELLQHSITLGDVLLVTLATHQVLGCHGVEAIQAEYLPHVLVQSAGGQAIVVRLQT